MVIFKIELEHVMPQHVVPQHVATFNLTGAIDSIQVVLGRGGSLFKNGFL